MTMCCACNAPYLRADSQTHVPTQRLAPLRCSAAPLPNAAPSCSASATHRKARYDRPLSLHRRTTFLAPSRHPGIARNAAGRLPSAAPVVREHPGAPDHATGIKILHVPVLGYWVLYLLSII